MKRESIGANARTNFSQGLTAPEAGVPTDDPSAVYDAPGSARDNKLPTPEEIFNKMKSTK